MPRRSFNQFFLWTAAVFVVVAIAAVLAIQWYASREIDAASRARDEQVVENGIALYTRTLAEKSFPQAYWDDAVLNLDNRFSPDWAREYIGVFFWRTERVEWIATLDRDDRLTFAMADGKTAQTAAAAPLRAAIAPLVAQVRKAELRRGPLPLLVEMDRDVQSGLSRPSSPVSKAISATAQERRSYRASGWAAAGGKLHPIAASGIVRVGNRLYAAAATLVQPDNTVLPLTGRSAIVVLAKELDARVIGAIGRDFQLADARLVTAPADEAQDVSRVRLLSPTGEQIGRIEWRSRQPGRTLVERTGPALALFSLLLALAAWLTMRKGSSIARELTESEARASRMAFTDKLTGLPNRPALEQLFEDLKARHEGERHAFGVMCIDIDRFKSVNDSYGHQAGDALLRQVASRIIGLGAHHDVLGRFGGDEFILICPFADAPRAERVAQGIVAALSAPFDIDAGRVFVGASVGLIIVHPDDDIDAQETFRRADLAMYRAKEFGRSQYATYDPDLDNAARVRREIHDSLRGAIAEGGLRVHYQPKYDDRDMLIGAEALVRWPEAHDKGITTDYFIRLAEETGLIEGLSYCVMRQVFTDARRWPGVPLSVNLSAVLMRVADFNQRVDDLIAETGVDPRQIEFEITEGVLLDQSDDTTGKLERLRALGSRIALDDFGTGYCGLSYLHRYPIDAVKIDISFTRLLGVEPQAEILVETIITLARALGLEVIAEGVETEDQRQRLLAAGCRKFQGYFTGRPMAAEDFTAAIHAGAELTSRRVP